MNYYTGDAKCAGCGRTGKEKPRIYKDWLCDSCKRLLALGKAKDVELKIEYTCIKQHYYAYRNDRVNSLAHKLLSALNNPHAPYKGYAVLKEQYGNNEQHYVINLKLVDPMRDFFNELDAYSSELKDAYDNLDKNAKLSLEQEKDRIYNEGIAKGRDMLGQLNRGEITLEQLSATKKYGALLD